MSSPPPLPSISPYILVKIQKKWGSKMWGRGGGGGEEAGEDPVKLNSFPPSLKRSHGGHGSTLPSGSLKLLISFSYSNDFLSLFLSLPHLLLQPPPPSFLRCFEVLVGNRGHTLEWYEFVWVGHWTYKKFTCWFLFLFSIKKSTNFTWI